MIYRHCSEVQKNLAYTYIGDRQHSLESGGLKINQYGVVAHSLEIKGLRSTFFHRKTLQNLLCLCKKKTQVVFFVFPFVFSFYPYECQCPGLCRPLFSEERYTTYYEYSTQMWSTVSTPQAAAKLKCIYCIFERQKLSSSSFLQRSIKTMPLGNSHLHTCLQEKRILYASHRISKCQLNMNRQFGTICGLILLI